MHPFAAGIVVAALAILASLHGGRAWAGEPGVAKVQLRIGDRAPLFDAQNLAKTGPRKISLKAALQAEPGPRGILLIFAEWPCEVCKRALPALAAQASLEAARVMPVVVLLDSTAEDRDRMSAFVEKNFTRALVVHDELGILRQRFFVEALPAFMMIDRALRIRAALVGFDGESIGILSEAAAHL